MPYPDPSQYPDPYPFRPPHQNVPPLSSSSSASTRSSAYASNGSALAYFDYNSVHVASSDDASDSVISPDAVAQMLANDPSVSSSARAQPYRSPDRSRWSGTYSGGVRSRSSSLGNGMAPHDHASPPQIHQKPSYDVSWQTVDEKDEVAMSEDETDDEHALELAERDLDHNRTAAAVVADEGRGLIVHGENVPIVQLQVQAGTTHLLIGSSPTPNSVPPFLTTVLPQIAHSLLALDISANFLGALPPVLAICENLEELNVASNPLRVLPVFLADLSNLCVLIADSTGITTLPDALVDLEKLHTISVRRNKLHSLPSWLCLLPALQTLCVDGNPFQGPWKALVDPLLARVPATPAYPPSTPIMPAALSPNTDTEGENETDATDEGDFSDNEVPHPEFVDSPHHEEDHTIMADRAPLMARSTTSPFPSSASRTDQPRKLTRTRTTPNRSYFDQSRANEPPVPPLPSASELPRRDEVRKMKSAGDLRRAKSGATSSEDVEDMPKGSFGTKHPTSLSSTNLLSMGDNPSQTTLASMEPPLSSRFASLGPNTPLSTGSRPAAVNTSRSQLSQSMWEKSGQPPPEPISRSSSFTPIPGTPSRDNDRRRPQIREKNSRWGFLKKMSMGKMKPDAPNTSPSGSPSSSRISPSVRPHTSAGIPSGHFGSVTARASRVPQTETRIIPTIATAPEPPKDPPVKVPPSSYPSLSPTLGPPPPSLLAPPSPSTLPRTKRRSFLPIDAPGGMALTIPENSPFVSGVAVSGEPDDSETKTTGLPSPTFSQEYIRREEDRAREAYMRALRSVMAYLRDMNDLSVGQPGAPLSMYGHPDEQPGAARSRRPTVVERDGNTSSSGLDAPPHLRPADSLSGTRSGTSSATLSMATTDSAGSSEERKFKDSKETRSHAVQEIIKTERTYVKQLQELVEIYIKPGSAAVNLISSVGSAKETVVPAAERKIVFGGIESLFSFHKESFLPALEQAAAPLIKSAKDADVDGKLSMDVARNVGNIFVRHAAFMKMYSTYINNFDNSIQRVSYWASDKSTPGTSTPGALSPSSSTAQLAAMTMTMGISANPGALAETATSGLPTLSASQKRRIKNYLKRCKLNPRHSQLNLEGYLLLPVQRIPRYKMMLEQLVHTTPPSYEFVDDPLDRALSEISILASNMNEGKRESESRRKLVVWQSRIRGRFPSPLVQPHRRLIMDGPLLLTRVVRKAVVSFEAINAQGDASTVQVDCLAPELTPRQLVGILCNDLLVLCRDPTEGQDPHCAVDLWAVLRMQTLPQPASIVHGNALRLVDNKAILYFDAPSASAALNWYRAINLHIPASKT